MNTLSRTLAHPIFRLLNFVIDSSLCFTLYLSTAYLLDLYVFRFNSYLMNYIYSMSLGMIIFLAYYSFLEYYFHKTLGKLLTGTKVVHIYEGKLSFLTILKRSLSRLIPIDFLFYLLSKRGLHDKLSKTSVIKG